MRPIVPQVIQILKTQRTEIELVPMEVTKDKILLVKTVVRIVVQDCLIKVTKHKILLKTATGIVVLGLKHGNTILTLK